MIPLLVRMVFLWGVRVWFAIPGCGCSGGQAMGRLMMKERWILLSHVRQLMMMMSVCVNVRVNDGGGGVTVLEAPAAWVGRGVCGWGA